MNLEDPWYRNARRGAAAVEHELALRADLIAGAFSRWRRTTGHCWDEELTGSPERIFCFQLDGRWYVGFKTVSDYVVDHGMRGLFCSRIRWHNVVGTLTGLRTSATGVRVCFDPLDIPARRAAFAAITPTTELLHPFPKHEEPGRETGSPEEGWFVSPERAEFLNLGESHIREYTVDRLSPGFRDRSGVVAYDPGCSTGKFLSTFASVNPDGIRTVGQDLSEQMVKYAAKHLDEVYHGDAAKPYLGNESADIVFVRFLNFEVVTTAQAREILPALVRTVMPGGLIVLLGHTPLLVGAAELADENLRVRQTTARQDDHVFQYYVCEKPLA